MKDTYQSFLEAKVAIAPKLGFDVDPAALFDAIEAEAA